MKNKMYCNGGLFFGPININRIILWNPMNDLRVNVFARDMLKNRLKKCTMVLYQYVVLKPHSLVTMYNDES